MRRYYCAICGTGRLAPSSASSDDVRVWCLPCSEKTGKLVRRWRCGSAAEAKELAKKREERIARERERNARAKARETARVIQESFSPPVLKRAQPKPVSCGSWSGVTCVYCSKPAGHKGDHYGHGHRWS